MFRMQHYSSSSFSSSCPLVLPHLCIRSLSQGFLAAACHTRQKVKSSSCISDPCTTTTTTSPPTRIVSPATYYTAAQLSPPPPFPTNLQPQSFVIQAQASDTRSLPTSLDLLAPSLDKRLHLLEQHSFQTVVAHVSKAYASPLRRLGPLRSRYRTPPKHEQTSIAVVTCR